MNNNISVKNICPKCSSLMEVRQHSRVTDKILQQPYYFSEWYFCPKCSFVKNIESKKIINNK